ncbi:hypothetical protein PIB30_089111 [Stylosanthes scabra]|uniref:Uncharacterized protein n=1 Tax=Stylosanthes scabra TaxID=79078 RepID=A0ABU6XRQ8_9FABA|nr:hypothetical protein [Stylosanthes scabra]
MKAKDTTAAVKAGSMSGNGAREAKTAAAVKCEGTTTARAGSIETPETTGNGHGEAAEGGSAGKPHHRGPPSPGCDPEPPPYSMNRARSTFVPEKKSRSGSCGTGPCPPDPRLHPLRNVLLSSILRLLVLIVPARLRILPPTAGCPLTLPPDIRALHPRQPFAGWGIAREDDRISLLSRSWGHITRQLKSPGILQQAILGQEPLVTGNRPPLSVFPTGPTGVRGGHDLNLMISGHSVALEAIPVCKLFGPPSVVTPGRGAKEPVQVHRVQEDGLFTAELPLHSIDVMKADVHEKNNRQRRKPCLDLGRLVHPGGLDGAPLRCHV